MAKVFTYHFQWKVKQPKEQFWALFADTNRFNHDTNLPTITREESINGNGLSKNFSFRKFGIKVKWEEEPFEWNYPEQFGVNRKYLSGPIKEMQVLCTLKSTPDGFTDIDYKVDATPANLLGFLAIPIQIGILSKRDFSRAVAQYEAKLTEQKFLVDVFNRSKLSSIERARLKKRAEELLTSCDENSRVSKLVEFIEYGDDIALHKIRPYEIADLWSDDRKEILKLCLFATRFGILDLRWDVLCPSCRGNTAKVTHLENLDSHAHCDSCNIDFTVNFHQLVEITFIPNPLIRQVSVGAYCMGGPQVTPHRVFQQIIAAGAEERFQLSYTPGSYAIVKADSKNAHLLRIDESSQNHKLELTFDAEDVHSLEFAVSPTFEFLVTNGGSNYALIIIERTKWIETAATAAEVSTFQTFRDLFSHQVLRKGNAMAVGSLAILFTDLKGSTSLYRNVGDVTAFGYVIDHFEILKKIVSDNNGALIKTIGDAIMAAFLKPKDALKSMVESVLKLRESGINCGELRLKAGIHYGYAIAVNLNNNLDYFGTTVNLAARLEQFSRGAEIILSETVFTDNEVSLYLKEIENLVRIERIESAIKGFDEENFQLYRVGVL